jgi:hypothetical protein
MSKYQTTLLVFLCIAVLPISAVQNSLRGSSLTDERILTAFNYNADGKCTSEQESTIACTIRVESKGWYDRGQAYARYYINDVLQDFKGGSSFDSPDVFNGFGTYGFNFARLRIVEGKCKLERIGRGYYSYGGSKCYDLARIRQKFSPGDIMFVGVQDTGKGCHSDSYKSLTAAGAVDNYGSSWRRSYALIGQVADGHENPARRICEVKSGSSSVNCELKVSTCVGKPPCLDGQFRLPEEEGGQCKPWTVCSSNGAQVGADPTPFANRKCTCNAGYYAIDGKEVGTSCKAQVLTSKNILFGVGEGTVIGGSSLYGPDITVSNSDPLTKPGYGPLECIRTKVGCTAGFRSSSATIDVRLQTPTSGPLHLVWATGGGHGSGTSFQYKSASNGAWQTLTSVIAQSSSDWGDVIVDVGTISDIKYRCHGGHWCKVGYFNVVKDTIGPAGIDGENGKDGQDGQDGKDGQDGVHGKNGIDGIDGKDGVHGKNGTAGLDGENGIDGIDGINGINGTNGIDGIDGQNGVNGKDGQDGRNGQNGQDGQDGKDGKDLRDVRVPQDEKEDLEKYYLLWIFVGMGICAICMAIVSLTVVMARLLLPKSKHSRKSTFQSNPIREVDAFEIRVPQVQQRNHTQNRHSHIRVHPSLPMVAVQYEQQ